MKKRILVKEKLYAINEIIIEGDEDSVEGALSSIDLYQDFDDYVSDLESYPQIQITLVDRGEPEPDGECEDYDTEVLED